MAIKFPSLKIFSTTNAKSRILVVVLAVIAVGVAIFLAVRYFGSDNPVSASRVAAAPGGLQSVPGGKISPEYYRALMQSNEQAAQQAKMQGDTAVPTLVNVPNQQQSVFQPQQNCTVLCPSPDDANVGNDINDLVKNGKLSQKDADNLLALAKSNVTVDEYAAALDELVKQGKLTPEQARQLLEKYKKQHQKALLNDSAKTMDGLIKSGQLSLDMANQLLALQKSGASPSDYAEELNRVAAQGKVSRPTASQLLGQYTQQQAAEATKQGVFALKKLAKSGAITPEVANQLADMQTKNAPVDQYASSLQQLVAGGKITPGEAAKLLTEYKSRRAMLGGTAGALEALVAEQAMGCQSDLKKLGQAANPQNLPLSCQKLNALKLSAQRLMGLQANNATTGAYANELKQAVQAGALTPESAAALMQFYEASTSQVGTPAVSTTLPTTSDFAKLQQAVQTQQPTQNNLAADQAAQAQFAAAQAQAQLISDQERQQRVQQMQAAMSAQAQSLLAAWQPRKMTHTQATPSVAKAGATVVSKEGATSSAAAGTGIPGSGPPLIKAGTIYFAVLDTAVDSDYPDTPVMATIVQGPFKGAKLLGKLALAQGQDRVSLSFNLMDMDAWQKSKSISAFAMDPDTARTVMASDVDHHYMLRYGSLFASSFLQGYAQGVQNAGTSTTGVFGTSTQNPKLSFGNNVAVALGQVGTTFSNVAQTYVNRPATVKVNAGVGLGILFMSELTDSDASTQAALPVQAKSQ